MKKLVKIVVLSLLAVVLAAVVAAVIAVVVIDPNTYRGQISAAVKKQTGRELTIEGKLKLSVFPWLGVKMGALQLSNAPGFGPAPFARVGSAEVRVKLLPLFHGAVEADKIVLDGLTLNLGRRADGTTNWSDLTGKAAASAPAPSGRKSTPEKKAASGPALAALAIGGIELHNAKVSWDDRMSGARYAVEHLNLVSGAIRLGQPFDVKLDFKVASNRPDLHGQVKFAGRVNLDLKRQDYRVQGLALTTDLSGKALPGGKLAARMQANVAADLKAQTLQIDALELNAAGIKLTGKVAGRRIIDAPQFSGRLQSGEFVPQDVIGQLGIKLPPMADPSAMTKASLALNFEGGLDGAALKDIQLRLDDTKLTGSASVRDFKRPVIRYQLDVDQIDADRYLPPPPPAKAQKTKAAATPGGAAAAAAVQLPVKLMRSLDIRGEVKVGKLKVMNLRSTALHATLTARDGLFHVYPVGAKLYGGSYDGNLTLDVRGATPVSSMDEKLSGVQAGPLLKDFMGKDYVTGEGTVSAKLTARGIDPMMVRKSLNGHAAFSFKNGAAKGINIGLTLRKAYAAYKKQPMPKDEAQQTDFAAIKGTATVKDGVVTNNDLDAKSPLLRVTGKGTANLVNETLNYRVEAAVVGSLQGQGGKELSQLNGTPIPIHFTGPFSHPKINVDIASVLREQLKKAVEAEKKKAEEKLKKDLQNKIRKQLNIKLKL